LVTGLDTSPAKPQAGARNKGAGDKKKPEIKLGLNLSKGKLGAGVRNRAGRYMPHEELPLTQRGKRKEREGVNCVLAEKNRRGWFKHLFPKPYDGIGVQKKKKKVQDLKNRRGEVQKKRKDPVHLPPVLKIQSVGYLSHVLRKTSVKIGRTIVERGRIRDFFGCEFSNEPVGGVASRFHKKL